MSPDTTQLTILHTNDLHARIEQLPFISAMAKRIRREVESGGGHALLWDAGDPEDRMLLESDVTKGVTIAAIMNVVGYDAAALGNSSAPTYGPRNLARIAETATFPILSANLVWSDTEQLVEGTVPYMLLEVGPAKLGLIGLTAQSNAYSIFGARSYPPVPIVRELASHLRERGATILALLSHLGLEEDKALAQAVDGIDLIVGGHTHDALEQPLVVNGALITQAGSYGNWLGRIDLELDNVSGRISARRARLLPVQTSEVDARVIEAIEEQTKEVQRLLGRFVGQTTTLLDINYFQECALGNFLADVLRQRMGTEVAFVVTGMLDEAIREGAITFGDLCRASSSTANPGRAELTGQQLFRTLNYGLRPEITQDRPGPLRGNPQGILQVSGLKVSYDPFRDPEEQVVEVLVGTEPLDRQRTYSVGATDWELGELTEYTHLDPHEVTYDAPTILREAMEEYLADHSPISTEVEGRMQPV
jgi:2',3'-cyclic-nucleotide 2'-phosphodiesterase (5'-nucleotidase family)